MVKIWLESERGERVSVATTTTISKLSCKGFSSLLSSSRSDLLFEGTRTLVACTEPVLTVRRGRRAQKNGGGWAHRRRLWMVGESGDSLKKQCKETTLFPHHTHTKTSIASPAMKLIYSTFLIVIMHEKHWHEK